MILDGLKDLVAEGFGASVPEEGGFPSEVEERHGIAVSGLIVDAFGEGEAVGEGFILMVAGGTGDGAVFGEGFVVKEFITEGDPLYQKGVVAGECGHGKTATHLEGEGGVIRGKIKRGDCGEGDFIGWVRGTSYCE